MRGIVRKKDVIEAIHKEFDEIINLDESGECIARMVEKVVEYMPDAEPEELKKNKCYKVYAEGRLVYEGGRLAHDYFECPYCGLIADKDERPTWVYCPQCGKRMGV